MTRAPVHITICICTFKRPNLLENLLEKLKDLTTEGLFTCSIVIVDNDSNESARSVVSHFSIRSPVPVTYCIEPRQNIALARNKAIQNATGDFIALIDDDELPRKDWLVNLLRACRTYNADGALGPVKPRFISRPPEWIIKSKFFERPEYETGYKMHWSQTRTGNVLFKKSILNGIRYPFHPQFGTGSEDVDFFRRMSAKGNIFIWCNEAVVYEIIPPLRCTLSYQLKLALLRGANSLKHRGVRLQSTLKSLVAIPVYSLALPVLFFAIRHQFMNYLVKLFDHLGRVLALIRLNPIQKRDL